MTLPSNVKKRIKAPKNRETPLWEGPESDGPQGGVTFSLLSRWLCCRERARLLLVEGLKPAPSFNPAIEFGSIWHACEEALAGPKPDKWQADLTAYCKQLCKVYPLSRDQIEVWWEKCKALFPVYVEYWAKHPDVVARTPLLQEQTFKVSYRLPSGRTVYLRGKWDSVDLVEEPKGQGAAGRPGRRGIWLQENKTKSSIDQLKINRQMSCDLQTMLYAVALQSDDVQLKPPFDKLPLDISGKGLIRGVRYNVVRRSAHKTAKSMMEKVTEDFSNNRADEWFACWNVSVTPNDVTRFRNECLDPILENVCDWWEFVTSGDDIYNPKVPYNRAHHRGSHWRHPFGVWNPTDNGADADLDHYMRDGSEVGLVRSEELFGELV